MSKPTKTELLKECLHVLNQIPNTGYVFKGNKTSSYELASKLDKLFKPKETKN